MIFSLSPCHWDSKWQTFNLLVHPPPKAFDARFAAYVWSKCFVLVTKFHSKVGVITFFHKTCDIALPVCHSHFTTYVTKLIWVISALSIHDQALILHTHATATKTHNTLTAPRAQSECSLLPLPTVLLQWPHIYYSCSLSDFLFTRVFCRKNE